MRTLLPLVALVHALAAAPTALACPDPVPSVGPLGTVTIGPGTAGSVTLYLVDRGLGDGVWLYEESNLVDGVQTGGCSFLLPNDCDRWYGSTVCPPPGWVSDQLVL